MRLVMVAWAPRASRARSGLLHPLSLATLFREFPQRRDSLRTYGPKYLSNAASVRAVRQPTPNLHALLAAIGCHKQLHARSSERSLQYIALLCIMVLCIRLRWMRRRDVCPCAEQ